MRAEACRALVMQSIVVLIVLLCFQVELDWAGCCSSTLPLKMAICRAISSYCTLCTLPEPRRHSNVVLKNIWARCHCDAAVAGRCVQSSDLFVQVDSPTVRRNRNKLPGDSLQSTCSGKLAEQVASATDVEPFLACLKMKESWKGSRDRIERRELLNCYCTNWK